MRLLCILLLLATSGFSQTLNVDTDYDIRRKIGDIVTIRWAPPTDMTGLVYYRIRRGDKVSGLFPVWVTIPYDKTSYQFTVTGPRHYFLTQCFSVTKNGVTTIQESVGSNQVRIRITK